MNRGLYQLLIFINQNIQINHNKLGKFELLSGHYLYTGSAQKNLIPRILRHLSKQKKKHWHIDFLLSNPNAKILLIKLKTDTNVNECELNLHSAEKFKSDYPILGFGSSDCKSCKSHLLQLNEP